MSDPSIKPERAADSVARHLETLILEGSLRPGEALLPERDLALALEVSRPTLREALKMLADRGLLEPVRVRGIRVASLGREEETFAKQVLAAERLAAKASRAAALLAPPAGSGRDAREGDANAASALM